MTTDPTEWPGLQPRANSVRRRTRHLPLGDSSTAGDNTTRTRPTPAGLTGTGVASRPQAPREAPLPIRATQLARAPEPADSPKAVPAKKSPPRRTGAWNSNRKVAADSGVARRGEGRERPPKRRVNRRPARRRRARLPPPTEAKAASASTPQIQRPPVGAPTPPTLSPRRTPRPTDAAASTSGPGGLPPPRERPGTTACPLRDRRRREGDERSRRRRTWGSMSP